MISARTLKDLAYVSGSFAADATSVQNGVRWALKERGYSIGGENLSEGVFTTTWMPSTSDSHALETFGRRDFGVNGAYHQLIVYVMPEGGRTRVEVASRVKTIVDGLKSTGIEERKVIKEIGNYLRTAEPTVTNLGLEE